MDRDVYFLLTLQLWECASVLFSIRCTRELSRELLQLLKDKKTQLFRGIHLIELI